MENQHNIEKLNYYSKKKIPFLFIIDFDMKSPVVLPIEEAVSKGIYFDINGHKNYNQPVWNKKNIELKKNPVSFDRYQKAFHTVKNELKKGNSFLLNLTFPTEIETNLNLDEVFFNSNAKYKLLYKDQFVVFSPETFVTIKDQKISSFPMKGTINASIPDAERKILSDEKEFAEHITIVDLIRNDLGIIAKDVTVDNFRYIDKIKTHQQTLLQVSSKISGKLEKNWYERLGEIMYAMLPAGSVTGAPKKKTVEIIKKVEEYDRGYYTGIFGYYDGKMMESAVMIRFIEKQNDKLIFKSGGGITIYSDLESEYNELLEKVYVPISRSN